MHGKGRGEGAECRGRDKAKENGWAFGGLDGKPQGSPESRALKTGPGLRLGFEALGKDKSGTGNYYYYYFTPCLGCAL